MSFREFLERRIAEGKVRLIEKTVSRRLEISGALHALGETGARFLHVEGIAPGMSVAGNLFPSKAAVAAYLGCGVRELIPRLSQAIDRMAEPEVVAGRDAPCQEVAMDGVDLDRLPILFHCERDGGNYISSGVMVSKDPVLGQNLDFHRCMQIGKDRMSVRVVKGRHFDHFLGRSGEVPVAVCVGNGAEVMVAAATSVGLGRDELGIAAALRPIRVVRALTCDLLIPADCEVVLEGVVRAGERAGEGPFVDLTETYDVVRHEPVLEVRRITHRRDPIWQALLPGGAEHKVLMGMPREPTIFREVGRAGVECLDVNIDPGGSSWLHAVIQIRKRAEDDGKKAIAAAHRGHSSLKHAFVVDDDIDPYDPGAVEWAMATRFQADRDFVLIGRERGSSLDPSSDPDTHLTAKCGFDLTKPLTVTGKNFEKARFPAVDLARILEGTERARES